MICGLCITAFRRYLKKKMKTNLYLHSERLQEFFRKPGEPVRGQVEVVQEQVVEVRGQVVEARGQVVDNQREEMSFGFSSSTVLQNAAQPEVNQDIKQEHLLKM